MKNKEKLDLGINSDTQELINKINNHLSILTKKDLSDFFDEHQQLKDSISKAFISNQSSLDMIVKYNDLVEGFIKAVNDLNAKLNDKANNLNQEYKDRIQKNENQQTLMMIKNTVENYKSLYLFSLKERALELAEDALLSKSIEKSRKIHDQYLTTLKEFNASIEKNNIVPIDTLKSDYNTLMDLGDNLNIESKTRISKRMLFFLITMLSIGISLMGVGIWMLTI